MAGDLSPENSLPFSGPGSDSRRRSSQRRDQNNSIGARAGVPAGSRSLMQYTLREAHGLSVCIRRGREVSGFQTGGRLDYSTDPQLPI